MPSSIISPQPGEQLGLSGWRRCGSRLLAYACGANLSCRRWNALSHADPHARSVIPLEQDRVPGNAHYHKAFDGVADPVIGALQPSGVIQYGGLGAASEHGAY